MLLQCGYGLGRQSLGDSKKEMTPEHRGDNYQDWGGGSGFGRVRYERPNANHCVEVVASACSPAQER